MYRVFLNIPVLFPFSVSRGNNEETTGMLVKVLKINTDQQHNDITQYNNSPDESFILQAEKNMYSL